MHAESPFQNRILTVLKKLRVWIWLLKKDKMLLWHQMTFDLNKKTINV